MIEELKLLKEQRENLEEQKRVLNEKQKVFEFDNEDLFNSISKSRDLISKLEVGIKESAVGAYDGINKKFEGGVGIRISKSIYYDNDKALAWSKEHMPVAIETVLNKKLFEKFAKDNELGFVKTEERITATIPSKIVVEE